MDMIGQTVPDIVPVTLNLSSTQDAGAFNFRRPMTPWH